MAVEFIPLVKVKGEKGNPGPVGPPGAPGPRGADGIPGTNGATTDATFAAAIAQVASLTKGELLKFLASQAYSTRLAPGFYQGAVPSGLAWPSSLPLMPSISVDAAGNVTGSAGFTAERVFDSRSWARQDPGITLYVSGAGSDTNDGLTLATAVRSIRRAVVLANTANHSRGARIFIDGSDPEAFRDGFGIYGTATYLKPVTDIAFIGINGTPVIGPWVDISGAAADVTFPNTSSVAYAGGTALPIRCIDTAYQDAQGVHPDMEWRDTPSEVNSQPGTWTLNAGKLYFRRRDGAVARPNSTKVFIDARPNGAMQGETDVYLENLRFLGGYGSGAVVVSNAVTGQPETLFVAKNVEASYAGGDVETGSTKGLDGNGFAVTNRRGFSLFFGCKAHGNKKDGFNWYVGNAGTHYALAVNCEAYDNGRWDALTCNGFTIHDTVVAVDIAGRYSRSRGGAMANVANSRSYALGTICTDDKGDILWGGTFPATQFRTDATAKLWVDHVMVAGDGAGFTATDTSQILVRGVPANPLPVVGNVTAY